MARIARFIPLKKPEREACVSHSHVHCVDASFVINSVRANGFSYLTAALTIMSLRLLRFFSAALSSEERLENLVLRLKFSLLMS